MNKKCSLGLKVRFNIVWIPNFICVNIHNTFLGASAKSRKATTGFVMSVRPSAWNSLAHTGWIFMKFDCYFSKTC